MSNIIDFSSFNRQSELNTPDIGTIVLHDQEFKHVLGWLIDKKSDYLFCRKKDATHLLCSYGKKHAVVPVYQARIFLEHGDWDDKKRIEVTTEHYQRLNSPISAHFTV